MPNSTVPAADAGLPSSWPSQQGQLFKLRYADWISARADLERLDRSSDLPDDAYAEAHAAASRRLQDATQLAITTHATEEWMVWRKFEILEQTMTENEDAPFVDRRCVWMLAGIKANLIALGIGRSEHDAD